MYLFCQWFFDLSLVFLPQKRCKQRKAFIHHLWRINTVRISEQEQTPTSIFPIKLELLTQSTLGINPATACLASSSADWCWEFAFLYRSSSSLNHADKRYPSWGNYAILAPESIPIRWFPILISPIRLFSPRATLYGDRNSLRVLTFAPACYGIHV